jgi:hypothetical protein
MARFRRQSLLARFNRDLFTKDMSTALQTWLVLEIGSFFLLPNFKVIPKDNIFLTWILISIPLGILGSILVGISSECIRVFEEFFNSQQKGVWILLAHLGGWLGLAGVGFPLSVVILEIWIAFSQNPS